MHVTLLTADLMLISTAQGAADRYDVQLTVAPNAQAALQSITASAADLLVIDLRTPGLNVQSLMADARRASGEPIAVMACGPHVHEASLAAAAKAGCDEVVTRGEFERRLDVAIARHFIR